MWDFRNVWKTGIILLIAFVPAILKADYHLNSQAEINAFGRSGILPTGLRIIPDWGKEKTDITDLSPLAGITGINGRLIIEGNPELESLRGLDQLSFIKGRIIITQNAALQNLDGLAGLQEVGDILLLEKNDQLQSLAGLGSVESKDGALFYLSIKENADLLNLDGLEWITHQSGDLRIQNNPSLQHVNGLSGLTFIEKSLILQGNDALQNLDGLAALQEVGESVILRGLTSLEQIDGLKNLKEIPWECEVNGNSALQNLDGFLGLQKINGPLRISFNLMLQNIEGLKNVVELDRIFDFYNNPEVVSLDVFHSLQSGSVTSMDIFRNEKLADISGLCHLINLNWDSPRITIIENPALKICTPILKWRMMEGMILEMYDNHPDCQDESVLSNLEPCPEENPARTAYAYSLQALYPNPVSGEACWLTFTLAEAGDVFIRVVDRMGRDKGFYYRGFFVGGQHLLKLNPASLPSGWNYISFESRDFRQGKLYYKE